MAWLMATLYDRFMRPSEEACLGEWRRDLLSGLEGDVLEVGAGTGVNLAYYPPGARLVLAEPDRDMAKRLEAKISGTRHEGARIDAADAEALPYPDESFDVVVSTLVLCSVARPGRALVEIGRVLRPGGRLVFIEHVGAEEGSSRRAWQGRIEPVWKHVAGGCCLTRDTRTSIARAGLTFERIDEESMRKALPFVRPSIRGVARKPKQIRH
jgi:ubiquinone/menaquinone biosynthesis C-methylase UbiE